ncbi:MAG TPA: hypothetical protein VJT54_05385 [Verrucomicrobiae bacterium]|nr:hypothetical protein [Verrucomicrobiae bacterium]
MKKSICLAVGLLALLLTPVFGQPVMSPPKPLSAPQAPPPSGTFQEHLQTIIERANPPANPPPPLTRFDLNFPGGTPAELVKAIEKAMGKPLNTIISDEDAHVQLPPLKMNHVNVAQLFQALEAASRKYVSFYNPGFASYSQQGTGYSFKTESGNLSDDSIWYFHVEKPTLPPVMSSQKVCRFYSLTPFLDRGFTVDDITTAIQTGWKMADVTSPPELNYHKETKLLIAYGEPGQLQTIDNVLQSLPSSNVTQTEIATMKAQINSLRSFTQDQLIQVNGKIDKLTEKFSVLTPTQAAAPGEKSGK